MGGRILTPDGILKLVALQFNVRTTELRSRKRLRTLVIPRRALCYLLRKHLLMSYPEIGKYLSFTDHTAVIHAVASAEKEMKKGGEFKKSIDMIESLGDFNGPESSQSQRQEVELVLRIPRGAAITVGHGCACQSAK
ncbi:MAG: hypothetical protein HY537_01995 [Deltaproteobacteria bacterium]|nr:hypothetical protein [Deltaproteobacteria bacterium]